MNILNADNYNIDKVLKKLDINKKEINNQYKKKINKKIYLILKYQNEYIKMLPKNRMYYYNVLDVFKKNEFEKYLFPISYIETGMRLGEISQVGASGLWQFMEKTGKLYNLKNTKMIDERFDAIKSTEAAIKYFKYLKKKFGRWYLVIMAYNLGEGKLSKAILHISEDVLKRENYKKYREYRNFFIKFRRGQYKYSEYFPVMKDIIDNHIDFKLSYLVDKYKGQYILPKETRDYILKAIAYAYVFEKLEMYELKRLKMKLKYMKNMKKLKLFLDSGQISTKEFLIYNKKFKNLSYKLKNFNILIPR